MTTNNDLLNYHRQNQEMKGTVVGDIYLRERINDFNIANKHKIDLLLKTLDDLQKEYFVHDAKGILQFEGEGRDRKPRSQLGMQPEEYTERRNKILAIPCEIKARTKK